MAENYFILSIADDLICLTESLSIIYIIARGTPERPRVYRGGQHLTEAPARESWHPRHSVETSFVLPIRPAVLGREHKLCTL